MKGSQVTETNEVAIAVESVSFQKNGVALLAYRQTMPAATTDDITSERWTFNLHQIAAQNGIPYGDPASSSPDVNDLYAHTVEERDELGAQLVEAVLVARVKADEVKGVVTDAFSNALPRLVGELDDLAQ